MFDYLTYEGRQYQTKDTPDQYMSEYRIVAGRLVGDEWHMEETPWNERPFPLAKGVMMRRVIDRAGVDQEWHGYLYLCGPAPDWRRHRAKFTDGNLVEFIEVQEDAA